MENNMRAGRLTEILCNENLLIMDFEIPELKDK